MPSNKGRSHPDVTPIVLDKLEQYFKPYNDMFYKAVGKKFGWDA